MKMMKIFGIVVIAAAIAFGAQPASGATAKTAVVNKAQKKKGFRNVLKSSLAFVADSAAFGTAQTR